MGFPLESCLGRQDLVCFLGCMGLVAAAQAPLRQLKGNVSSGPPASRQGISPGSQSEAGSSVRSGQASLVVDWLPPQQGS